MSSPRNGPRGGSGAHAFAPSCAEAVQALDLPPTFAEYKARRAEVAAAGGAPERLVVKGVAGSTGGELFPHLYGALPLEAVRLAEPWRP